MTDKDLDQRLDEILTQVAWYGSYKRSGDKPEGPTLSPEEAKQAIQAHYAKQQSKLNQIQDALNMQEKLMRDYHGRPDCKNCSLAEVVQGILTQDTTNTKGGEDE